MLTRLQTKSLPPSASTTAIINLQEATMVLPNAAAEVVSMPNATAEVVSMPHATAEVISSLNAAAEVMSSLNAAAEEGPRQRITSSKGRVPNIPLPSFDSGFWPRRGNGKYDHPPRPGYKWDIHVTMNRPRQIKIKTLSSQPHQCRRGNRWVIDSVTQRPRWVVKPINNPCECNKCVEAGCAQARISYK